VFWPDGYRCHWGTITIAPSIDSIQEFEMQTSSFTAQFGASPVFVNVATKSGTNIPHGTLYEFDREAFLNAQNFFVTPATAYLPWHQHNFGGTIGGLIVLPHLFNGKDKTFFFFSYEGQRIISKSPSTMSVPPAAYRNGDFSSLLPGTVVKDPLTGTAFSGNIIPSNHIAAYAPFVINYWPLPARSGLVNNYTVGTPTISGDDQYLARIDHQLGSNDHLYGRWAETSPLYRTSVAGTGGNPNFAGVFTQAGQNLLVGETHGFGPQTVNEFRFAYNRSLFQASGSSAVNLASQLNWGGVTETIGMPVVTVNGTNASFKNLADQTPGGYNQETYQFSDNLSMHRGKHTLTFGEDIFDMRSTINVPGGFQPPFPRATATFNGTFSGNAFADFLLGFTISGNQTFNKAGYVSPAMNYSYPDFNFYGQDDWKISRKFTFNIGLRYELVPVLQNPGMRNFDFQAGQLSTQGVPAPFYRGSDQDFAPRVGFAWQPFENGKTVVRAGYGWYYARAVSYGPAKLANNPPAQTVASFTNAGISAASAVTMTTFVTNTNPAVTQGGILWAIDPNFTPTPLTQIRSFDIQHQLPAGFLVDVGYKGSLTTHQDGLVDQNTAPPGAGSVNPRRPFPAYATIDDMMSVFNANYNAGIVRVEKRMGKGLSMLSSYSYSKCMDEVGTPDGNSEETDGTLGAQNRFDIAAEKGLCGMHILHRAVFSYIYQLPFGP
jgi:hypothetical protein